jgi:succinyl-CoA synthetase beta subunit
MSMNLHEYQAKQILAEYGLPVPHGVVIQKLDEAAAVLEKFKSKRVVVKAQVHAGGRGKAGGVKLVDKLEDLLHTAEELLHKRLVTYQTDSHGQPVNSLLIEETSDIARELYLSVVVDRSLRRIVFMASTEGGMDIEKVAEEAPEKIIKIAIDPLLGVMQYQCRELAYALQLDEKQQKQFSSIVINIGKMFVEKDFSLLEINPLIVTKDGDLVCLDAKINVDDNALYRQPQVSAMWDPSQEDPREIRAKEWGISYISLEGNIGCMVNGAGLAMATMDLIKLSGGEPANFLDVGGSATQERVTEAFKIILSDNKVKGVLVNIFGGIVRCDLIAAGIIAAVAEVGIQVPVVVRLEGNHAQEGAEMLKKSNLNIIAAQTLQDAADQIVRATGGER